MRIAVLPLQPFLYLVDTVDENLFREDRFQMKIINENSTFHNRNGFLK